MKQERCLEHYTNLYRASKDPIVMYRTFLEEAKECDDLYPNVAKLRQSLSSKYKKQQGYNIHWKPDIVKERKQLEFELGTIIGTNKHKTIYPGRYGFRCLFLEGNERIRMIFITITSLFIAFATIRLAKTPRPDGYGYVLHGLYRAILNKIIP
jgi:hypothetical protein